MALSTRRAAQPMRQLCVARSSSASEPVSVRAGAAGSPYMQIDRHHGGRCGRRQWLISQGRNEGRTAEGTGRGGCSAARRCAGHCPACRCRFEQCGALAPPARRRARQSPRCPSRPATGRRRSGPRRRGAQSRTLCRRLARAARRARLRVIASHPAASLGKFPFRRRRAGADAAAGLAQSPSESEAADRHRRASTSRRRRFQPLLGRRRHANPASNAFTLCGSVRGSDRESCAAPSAAKAKRLARALRRAAVDGSERVAAAAPMPIRITAGWWRPTSRATSNFPDARRSASRQRARDVQPRWRRPVSSFD